MDNTPETPDHVPASDEVREMQARHEHTRKVKRLRFWYRDIFLITAGMATFGVVFNVFNRDPSYPEFLAVTVIAIVWMWMYAWSRLGGTNHAYRHGYQQGMSMGLITATRAMEQAREHPEAERLAIRAVVPNYWEQSLINEAIVNGSSYVRYDDDDPASDDRP